MKKIFEEPTMEFVTIRSEKIAEIGGDQEIVSDPFPPIDGF